MCSWIFANFGFFAEISAYRARDSLWQASITGRGNARSCVPPPTSRLSATAFWLS